METLDILHPIKTELLSPKYYFQSLARQARYCGLLSDRELSAMQADLLLILAEQTDKPLTLSIHYGMLRSRG